MSFPVKIVRITILVVAFSFVAWLILDRVEQSNQRSQERMDEAVKFMQRGRYAK